MARLFPMTVTVAASLLLGASASALNRKSRQACRPEFQQCGGIGWSGATCCAGATSCVVINDYYHQCVGSEQDNSGSDPSSVNSDDSSNGSGSAAVAPGDSGTFTCAGVSSNTWTVEPDGNGRTELRRDGVPTVIRGVSMTGFETGTRGTQAGGGYWLFDPPTSDVEMTKTIMKNVVKGLIDESGWSSNTVRIPICGSAWLQQYRVKNWAKQVVADYIEWVDMAVCEALQQGAEAVIIDNHLWAIGEQTGKTRGDGFEDGCTGINHIEDNGQVIDSCAPHDWFGAYTSSRPGVAGKSYNAGDDQDDWQCSIANADGVTIHNLMRTDPVTGVQGLEHFKNLWYDLALHFKDNENVIFELWNEPYQRTAADFGDLSSKPKGPAFGDPFELEDYEWEMWTQVFDETIKVIREDAGADNIIIVSGLDWDYDYLGDGTTTTGGPIARPDQLLPWVTRGVRGITYGFHPYQHGSCCGQIGATQDLSQTDPYQSAFCLFGPKDSDGNRLISNSALPVPSTCDTDGYAETVDKKSSPCVWAPHASRSFMNETLHGNLDGTGICAGDREMCAGISSKTECDEVYNNKWDSPESGGWSKYVMPMAKYGPLVATEFGSFDCSSPFNKYLLEWMRRFDVSYTSWALWPQNSGGPGAGACGYPSTMVPGVGASDGFGKGTKNCQTPEGCIELMAPLPWAATLVYDDLHIVDPTPSPNQSPTTKPTATADPSAKPTESGNELTSEPTARPSEAPDGPTAAPTCTGDAPQCVATWNQCGGANYAGPSACCNAADTCSEHLGHGGSFFFCEPSVSNPPVTVTDEPTQRPSSEPPSATSSEPTASPTDPSDVPTPNPAATPTPPAPAGEAYCCSWDPYTECGQSDWAPCLADESGCSQCNGRWILTSELGGGGVYNTESICNASPGIATSNACMDWNAGSVTMTTAASAFAARAGLNVAPIFGVGSVGHADSGYHMGSCFEFQLAGVAAPLLMQAINEGGDVNAGSIDVQMAAGGEGAFLGCSDPAGGADPLFPTVGSYPSVFGECAFCGGPATSGACDDLPSWPSGQSGAPSIALHETSLNEQCRVSFALGLRLEPVAAAAAGNSNPRILSRHQVPCPAELVQITGLRRTDDPTSPADQAEFLTSQSYATRMLDCCKPSAGWANNVNNPDPSHPAVMPCGPDGFTRLDGSGPPVFDELVPPPPPSSPLSTTQSATPSASAPSENPTVRPPSPNAGVELTGNPFADNPSWYVNPTYDTNIDATIETLDIFEDASTIETLETMKSIASAYWLDVKAKAVRSDANKASTATAHGILEDAYLNGKPMVTFIIYDLPNRDCHALASNGEICCEANPDGTCNYQSATANSNQCADGLAIYMHEYIDPLVALFAEYGEKGVPITLVIEPDSLPNLVTNNGDPRCGNAATTAAYKQGIAYAVEQFATHTSAVMYLDGAHGGWLGWDNNMAEFAQLMADLTSEATGEHTWKHLRGFSTNVAGYQQVGTTACPADIRNTDKILKYCSLTTGQGGGKGTACCEDPCGLADEWNSGVSETNYIAIMHYGMTTAIPGWDPRFVIDTGRSGVGGARTDCENWCNVRGAGVGKLPTTTDVTDSRIDALFWLKTPGESDGCTQTLPSGDSCPRFDGKCGSVDSLGSASGEPRAPEAGHWFMYQIVMLAENADLHLEVSQPSADSTADSTNDANVDSNSADGNVNAEPEPGCSQGWDQCGGRNWAGPTCCISGFSCQFGNEWYSQCAPTRQRMIRGRQI